MHDIHYSTAFPLLQYFFYAASAQAFLKRIPVTTYRFASYHPIFYEQNEKTRLEAGFPME